MKNSISLLIILTSLTAMAEPALVIKSKGRAPQSGLKVKSSLVPTYSLVNAKGGKITTIPLLDIGLENSLSVNQLSPLRLPAQAEVQLKPVQVHKPIELARVPQMKNWAKATPAKKATSNQVSEASAIKELAAMPEVKTQAAEPKLEKLQEMSPNDYKLLQALIFSEIHQNYELAMGLFAELLEDPKHHIEALYQYALTAKGLGLNSEFREYMLKVAKETKDNEWKTKATQSLVDNIEKLETSDVQYIEPLLAQTTVNVSQNELYQLTRAKYYLNQGQLGPVEESVVLIPSTSKYYDEAQLVLGLYDYRRGKLDEAIVDLDKLMAQVQKSWPLRSVAAITLARMYFQKSQYKEAFQAYLQVDKSDPLWLQAMVEQAWTQILSEDYEGAAGNMFSLHTDFFKNSFAPESYVVRTVGYLNLCQFGDGLQVLNEMKKRYGNWKDLMVTYQKNHKNNSDYYDTVKTYLKNSDLKEVDGLPRSFIVELARHPSFLNVQNQINTYEDEISKFNNITLSLIKMQKDIATQQNKVIKEAKNAEERENLLAPLKIRMHIAKKAVDAIKDLRQKGVARIEKEKLDLRGKASFALQARFKELATSLDKVLGQNEVLQYELYSGAGEHIRYQMAGGDVNDKQREELKVKDGKSLYWKTKGEVWEDEVGHYRSSLKNVCPQETAVNK